MEKLGLNYEEQLEFGYHNTWMEKRKVENLPELWNCAIKKFLGRVSQLKVRNLAQNVTK